MKLDAYWQLEGTLTTASPMHIGNGNAEPHQFPLEEDTKPSEVQLIARDVQGTPIIPGSALKGVLKRRCGNSDTASALFGKMESGGLVQFLDSIATGEIAFNENILRRTAIDAIRGTAEEHLLFAHWMVPVGTEFNVRIRGRSYETDAWKRHAALLNHALNSSLQFGAWSGNDRGKCTWKLSAVRVLDSKAIAEWIKSPYPVDSAFSPDRLADRSIELESTDASEFSKEKRRIEITLNFKGHHFLVNDPHKIVKGQDGKEGRSHAARRTTDGKLMLPAESFRGVLAHQAARIARTCGKSGERQEVRLKADGSFPGDIDCVTRLFGGPGWKSVLSFDDFRQVGDEPNSKTQEFVAVDRFTAAGGMDNRKFNAEGGWQPQLKGAVTIDSERLEKFGDPTASLGLLALVLRDLADGDLSFGWGASKGYGWTHVDTSSAVQWVESNLNGLSAGSVNEWIEAWAKGGL
jgi:CRISPR/Cas system CSM-associated protein Csm3 (group 7 of RAMP superfamily)